MSEFSYKARDQSGKPTSGVLEAASREEALDRLHTMGYIPIEVKGRLPLRAAPTGQAPTAVRRARAKEMDVAVFTRQLAVTIRAGLPILASLDALAQQPPNKKFQWVIQELAKGVEGGVSFSEVLSRFPGVFNGLYVSTIRSAEVGGNLDETLRQLATLLEREQQNKAKIKSAMRYPTMVISVVALAFIFIMWFVIPKFAELFSRFDVALPLPTQILLGTYAFLKNYWYLVLLGLVGGFIGMKLFIRTTFGRRFWDGMKLRLPVFGQLFLRVSMSRFARTLATLTRSGVPILTTLGLLPGTVGNVVVAQAINRVSQSVSEGRGMAEPMRVNPHLFPPLIASMVAIGEETGRVEELLINVAEWYEEETDRLIKGLAETIEPILLLFLGGIVLVLALGVFLPMWNLAGVFRG